MTRVLWVANEPPDYSFGGGSIRAAHLLAGLSQRAEVDLLLAGELKDAAIRGLFANINLIAEQPPVRPPRNHTQRRLRELRYALLESQPAEVAASAALRRRVYQHLARAPEYDIVNMEHSEMAPLLPRHRGNRWTMTMHQLVSRRTEHDLAIGHNAKQRWLKQRQLRKAQQFERWAVKAYDAVFVCSAEDAAALGGRAIVIPNGVDTRRFVPTPLPAEPRLVFMGTLNWWPNIDAANWFCAEVMPLIRKAMPDATLDVVGRMVNSKLDISGAAGVRLHTDVASIVPYLQGARVVVVPLRIGSGTRIKALEAMAAGRPVVGTSIGLEGLGVVNGEEALIADEPSAMADAIVELMRNDERALRMVAAARTHVEEHFTWDDIGRKFADAVIGD